MSMDKMFHGKTINSTSFDTLSFLKHCLGYRALMYCIMKIDLDSFSKETGGSTYSVLQNY